MHGVDWDAKVAEAKDAVDKAPSLNIALSQIAALIDSPDDSHTFMLPPEHAYRHDYGFAYQMLGNQCVVTRRVRIVMPKRRELSAAMKFWPSMA